jgi:hypothetical protein
MKTLRLSLCLFICTLSSPALAQWQPDGVALCTAANNQFALTIVSDGAGGAIVTWHDFRSGSNDIYAQRVNASGVPQWTADGVALCVAANNQYSPMIVSDGFGGAIVTWYDFRSGTNYDIYAQRVNASGVPQWTANGVALCTAANDQFIPTPVSDGSGGAVVTWYDYRSGNFDIYAQRVNASGVPQWTANGVALCTAANDQYLPRIVSDGSGGAIITWYDFRSGNYDIYAQRVNASGAPQWTADGVALCTAANNQLYPTIVSNGSGGAIVTWYDSRSGSNDIYAQRVNASGAPLWTADGVALCTAANEQYAPTIVSDGSGGAIITWYDLRSGTNYDIYAQRVNASGVPQWTADGVALCTAANEQSLPTIVSDGSGGAIATWNDSRSGNFDIYAQRVEPRYGYWGHPEPAIVSVADIPGDQGGRVKVNWTASDWDVLNLQTITHYSIWRATEFEPTAATRVSGASAIGADFNGTAFRRDVTDEYYWEWIGNQDALYSPRYSFSASTRADSTGEGASEHYFQVVSHTANQFVFWPSNVGSGHSVDNLAPAAPLYLTAQRSGPDVNLRWNRVRVLDLRDYSVYRATSSGVTPVPINFLSSSDDTVLVDASVPTSALYYIVTAYDVHENQSARSNEASVGALTSVGNLPPIHGLTVLDNVPNPFGATDVEIDVFDVSGRPVRSERTVPLAAGWREIPFDTRDDAGRLLPSGVYFYRVRASGQTINRKMVIAR